MNEQIKKFDELYAKMAQSKDVQDMHLFGKVMREAMTYVSEHAPAKADELLEELCAICWDNYLTRKEAEEIVSMMSPAPKWTRDHIKRGLEAKGLALAEEPYYNECALITTISMIASDSGETLAKYVSDESQMLELCYHLALDKLKDKDKVFNIRKYFEV